VTCAEERRKQLDRQHRDGGCRVLPHPYSIHKLGDDAYGTWNLINSITGYLGLLVLGVPMASVRYFAQHVARGEVSKLNEAIGSCTMLYLLLGGIALVIGVGLYAFFTLTYHIRRVSTRTPIGRSS